jgi:hypothetical protein
LVHNIFSQKRRIKRYNPHRVVKKIERSGGKSPRFFVTYLFILCFTSFSGGFFAFGVFRIFGTGRVKVFIARLKDAYDHLLSSKNKILS